MDRNHPFVGSLADGPPAPGKQPQTIAQAVCLLDHATLLDFADLAGVEDPKELQIEPLRRRAFEAALRLCSVDRADGSVALWLTDDGLFRINVYEHALPFQDPKEAQAGQFLTALDGTTPDVMWEVLGREEDGLLVNIASKVNIEFPAIYDAPSVIPWNKLDTLTVVAVDEPEKLFRPRPADASV